MPNLVDLTGKRFGRLVVLERAENKGQMTAWKCLCDCGKETVISGANLKRGHTKSCGCYHREVISQIAKGNKTHGKTNDRLYRIWSSMKTRCYDTNSDYYRLYGGRGITVCDEWLGINGYANFRSWAYANGYDENAPKGQCTLDRANNDGNYEPSNCRWVTMKQQSNNKRNNHFLTINGETKTISEWSMVSGISKITILSRVKKGWTANDAVFHDLMRKRRTFNETN